jgi:DNA-binding Lrp family transcriptional regulator
LKPDDTAEISQQIDDINLKIIDILNKDARAHRFHRVRRMMETRIINKFTISVDNNTLGYDYLVFIGIKISPGYADQIMLDLLKVEEVLEIHELHSKFDLLLKVRAKNLNQLRDIVENKICKIPHISKTELMIVLKTKKEEQMISLEKDIEYKEMLYLNDDDRLRSFSNLSLIGE